MIDNYTPLAQQVAGWSLQRERQGACLVYSGGHFLACNTSRYSAIENAIKGAIGKEDLYCNYTPSPKDCELILKSGITKVIVNGVEVEI